MVTIFMVRFEVFPVRTDPLHRLLMDITIYLVIGKALCARRLPDGEIFELAPVKRDKFN